MSTKLNKGDIIIFKAEEDWLSKSIAWLTDSDVSHAAMVYSEDSIIEVGANGIGIHKVDVTNERGAYVMRLHPQIDTAPLIRSADNYMQAQIRYDFPALFLLAGLLVHKKIKPTAKLLSMTNRILSLVCLEIDKYIQRAVLHHEERAMVCSQLVYQIFYDCGGSYRIQTEQTEKNLLSDEKNPSTVCLMELANELSAENEFFSNAQPSKEWTPECSIPFGDKELKDLYHALLESEDAVLNTDINLLSSFSSSNQSIHYTKKFLDKTKELLSLLNSGLPIDAMFITPADLAYHAVNLKKQGLIGINRVPASK